MPKGMIEAEANRETNARSAVERTLVEFTCLDLGLSWTGEDRSLVSFRRRRARRARDGAGSPRTRAFGSMPFYASFGASSAVRRSKGQGWGRAETCGRCAPERRSRDRSFDEQRRRCSVFGGCPPTSLRRRRGENAAGKLQRFAGTGEPSVRRSSRASWQRSPSNVRLWTALPSWC